MSNYFFQQPSLEDIYRSYPELAEMPNKGMTIDEIVRQGQERNRKSPDIFNSGGGTTPIGGLTIEPEPSQRSEEELKKLIEFFITGQQ